MINVIKKVKAGGEEVSGAYYRVQFWMGCPGKVSPRLYLELKEEDAEQGFLRAKFQRDRIKHIKAPR